MEFTLVSWDTTLKASNRNRGHSFEKHQIRRNLSEQIENLWRVNKNLRQFDPRQDIRAALAKQYETDGVEFVPLVMAKWRLFCELDILFLRAGDPGSILFDGGDIDNRMKTLFDALRVPRAGEMKLNTGETNPARIYCLLEDDKLITSIKVKTDRLLVAPSGAQDEACLTIRVHVRGTSIDRSPWEFGW